MIIFHPCLWHLHSIKEEVMQYQDIRSQIKSGDLFAWRNNSLFDRLIRIWTAGSYNHVGIAWVKWGRVFVLQDRMQDGIDMVALSRQLPCDWISTNAIWNDEVEEFAFQNMGQHYGHINILTAALNTKPIGNAMVCSEYASAILKKAGIVLPNQPNWSPSGLVDELLNQNKILQNIKE